MSLDRKIRPRTQNYIDYWNEQLLKDKKSRNWVFNISRKDESVLGYIEDFEINNGIDEIIKIFENDLKTAKEVSIYICVPVNSDFPQLNILTSIEKIIKSNCDIFFNLSVNDENIMCTSLRITISQKVNRYI